MRQTSFLSVTVRLFDRPPRVVSTRAPARERKPTPHVLGREQPVDWRPWTSEDFATEPLAFLRGVVHAAVFLLAIATVLPAAAAIREVGPIELTVHDLDRELRFYTNVLPFKLVSVAPSEGAAVDRLLSLESAQLRTAELSLRGERLRLTEHRRDKGRTIPADSRSFDHWFQHIAIVVSDIDRAYAVLRSNRVQHVSTAPQTLPAWNRDAGGIKAFYFRDPEDHVLELIWFPAGKGDPKWQTPTRDLFLGIDHTAIVVSDTERSLAFYTNILGLTVAGTAENHGIEQEHLNQVFGARLRITALRAQRGPGVELLEYLTPPGGRPLPAHSKANDLVFSQTWLQTDELRALNERLRESNIPPFSREWSDVVEMVRDPDGHALRLMNSPYVSASAR